MRGGDNITRSIIACDWRLNQRYPSIRENDRLRRQFLGHVTSVNSMDQKLISDDVIKTVKITPSAKSILSVDFTRQSFKYVERLER